MPAGHGGPPAVPSSKDRRLGFPGVNWNASLVLLRHPASKDKMEEPKRMIPRPPHMHAHPYTCTNTHEQNTCAHMQHTQEQWKYKKLAVIKQAVRESAKGDKEPSSTLPVQSQWYQSRDMRNTERCFCFQETFTLHKGDSLQRGQRIKV